MYKNKNRLSKFLFLLILCAALIPALQYSHDANAATYRQGSSGETVRQIQQKLISLGYLTGTADGIYGSKTANAVYRFQIDYGLTADGICGSYTLKSLGITDSSQSSSSQSGSSSGSTNRENDLYLLSRIISAEARGEVYQGQVAVGAVIINRTKHPSFPDTISGVIYQPGAFTAIVDGQFNEPISDTSRRAAQDALNGMDPSGGAIYYYNPAKTTNAWIYSRQVIKTIGKHIFAK